MYKYIVVQNILTSVCSNSYDKVIYRNLGKVSKSYSIKHIEVAASKDVVNKLLEDREVEKRARQSDHLYGVTLTNAQTKIQRR